MIEKHAWTRDMVDTFVRLHRDGVGHSFAEISRMMSEMFAMPITKNACIGKARRLGLPVRDPGKPARVAVMPRPTMVKASVRVDAPIPPEPEPAAAPAPGVDIYQLGSGVCRWPLGEVTDRPPYRYCGGHAPIEAPYCAKHHKAAYHTPRPFQVAV